MINIDDHGHIKKAKDRRWAGRAPRAFEYGPLGDDRGDQKRGARSAEKSSERTDCGRDQRCSQGKDRFLDQPPQASAPGVNRDCGAERISHRVFFAP